MSVSDDAFAVAAALREYLGEGDLTCILCDRGAARALPFPWHARFGAPAFAGVAQTVSAPAGSLVPVRKAVADLSPDTVPVIGAEGFGGAVWGGRLSRRARAAGAAGVVVIGRVRDVATLAEDPLGVVALGVSPQRSEARNAGSVGAPLVVGALTLRSGEVIVADANGVVSVASSARDDVLTNLHAWIAQERATDQEDGS